jgi:hypothetical protein
MENSEITLLQCAQCGGELHPDEGMRFLKCPFCDSSIYVDKAQVVFHWYLADTLTDEKAQRLLAQWMSGNETVKDLDQKSKIVSSSFSYFPVWMIRTKSGDGEKVYLEPAAATTVTELKTVRLQAGDLSKFGDNLNREMIEPTIPLDTALEWLDDSGGPVDGIEEIALVHLPIYVFKYSYSGQTYTALVEGANGSVLANLFPAKDEVIYRAIGIVTAAIFLMLAQIPICTAILGRGMDHGLGFCIPVGLLVAPIIFIFALSIAAKV